MYRDVKHKIVSFKLDMSWMQNRRICLQIMSRIDMQKRYCTRHASAQLWLDWITKILNNNKSITVILVPGEMHYYGIRFGFFTHKSFVNLTLCELALRSVAFVLFKSISVVSLSMALVHYCYYRNPSLTMEPTVSRHPDLLCPLFIQ